MNLPNGYTDESGRPMGLFLDMPEAQYHAVKAFSYSYSKALRKSPAHAQVYLNKKWEVDPDRERFKAVHLLTLEPEKQTKLVIKDGVWRDRVKDEVIRLQSEGKIVLKQKDYDEAKAISEIIKSDPYTGNIISKSYGEVSIFWIDKKTGVYCKARIDLLYIDDEGIILGDLKNYGDVTNEWLLEKFIDDNRYHWQFWHYDAGIREVFGVAPINHFWFFIESDEPYTIATRICTDPMLEHAEKEMRPLIDLHKDCTRLNKWPRKSSEAEPGNLPSYSWERE